MKLCYDTVLKQWRKLEQIDLGEVVDPPPGFETPLISNEEARELVDRFKKGWPNSWRTERSGEVLESIQRIALRLEEQADPEIAPCGVCGLNADVDIDTDNEEYYVYCDGGGCGCQSSPQCKTRALAIRYWNAAQRAIRAEMERKA